MMIKLADWCKKHGIKYLTGYRWFKDGKMPVEAYQTDTGTILVADDDEFPETSEAIVTDNRLSESPVSQLIKKAVEISKAGAPVEDLATFVISNFKLEKHGVAEVPLRRSRMKPTKEMTENHFKKFMTTKSKPEAQMFLVNENDLEKVVAASEKVSSIDEGMGVELTGAQNFGTLVPSTTAAAITTTLSKDQSIASVMDTVMHNPQNLVATPKPLTSLDFGSGSFYRSIDGGGAIATNSTLSAATASVSSAINFAAPASLLSSDSYSFESNVTESTLEDYSVPVFTNEARVYSPVTYDEARALVTLTSPDLLDSLTIDRRAKQFCQLDRESFDNLYKSVLASRK